MTIQISFITHVIQILRMSDFIFIVILVYGVNNLHVILVIEIKKKNVHWMTTIKYCGM